MKIIMLDRKKANLQLFPSLDGNHKQLKNSVGDETLIPSSNLIEYKKN